MARMTVMMCLLLMLEADVTPLSEGMALPQLSGDFLTGRKAVLPTAAAGKVALLALGFTYDSRFPVEAWTKRFRQEFGTNPAATFFEIPMIGGFGRLGRWFIDSGMRRGTPKELHENVITVYGGTDPWKRRVGFNDPDIAYLILLDREGRVRWLHAGPLDEERFSSLAAVAAELLEPPQGR
jgi:hypothetical protein